eukprot:10185040-Alexandrium_andersonii.AAC.1
MRTSTGTGPSAAAKSTKDGGKRAGRSGSNAHWNAEAATVHRKTPGAGLALSTSTCLASGL